MFLCLRLFFFHILLQNLTSSYSNDLVIRKLVIMAPEQVRHSLLHIEQSLLALLDSYDPEGQEAVHVRDTE